MKGLTVKKNTMTRDVRERRKQIEDLLKKRFYSKKELMNKFNVKNRAIERDFRWINDTGVEKYPEIIEHEEGNNYPFLLKKKPEKGYSYGYVYKYRNKKISIF